MANSNRFFVIIIVYVGTRTFFILSFVFEKISSIGSSRVRRRVQRSNLRVELTSMPALLVYETILVRTRIISTSFELYFTRTSIVAG